MKIHLDSNFYKLQFFYCRQRWDFTQDFIESVDHFVNYTDCTSTAYLNSNKQSMIMKYICTYFLLHMF